MLNRTFHFVRHSAIAVNWFEFTMFCSWFFFSFSVFFFLVKCLVCASDLCLSALNDLSYVHAVYDDLWLSFSLCVCFSTTTTVANQLICALLNGANLISAWFNLIQDFKCVCVCALLVFVWETFNGFVK